MRKISSAFCSYIFTAYVLLFIFYVTAYAPPFTHTFRDSVSHLSRSLRHKLYRIPEGAGRGPRARSSLLDLLLAADCSSLVPHQRTRRRLGRGLGIASLVHIHRILHRVPALQLHSPCTHFGTRRRSLGRKLSILRHHHRRWHQRQRRLMRQRRLSTILSTILRSILQRHASHTSRRG